MLKTIAIALLPFLVLIGSGLDRISNQSAEKERNSSSGTVEKMIVANGTATMDLNLSRLGGVMRGAKAGKSTTLRFDVEQDSFFQILVMNDELRGPIPSAMKIIPQTNVELPGSLAGSYNDLVVESLAWGGPYDLAIRSGRTGFTYFNIEGYLLDYNPSDQSFGIQVGRVVMAAEYANELGRPSDAGALVGQISISAKMRTIEVTQLSGDDSETVLPGSPEAGTVPGPDVIVGDVNGLAQFGSSSGTQVGLALGTDSCNQGVENLHWFAMPDNDHPVIPQNLYRMSGGATNDERFEQIGQSSVKHAFTALTQNICNLGCNGVGGTNLGSGCSDPYTASLNSGPNLGSKAWINPYTGAYPRGDSATNPNSHTAHTHTGTSHRILTEIADLNTSLNPGASYFAEGQYVTPHEYVWCQGHPGQCNQNNNVSFRRYSVSGTASPFSFAPVGSTTRMKPAIDAWTGSTKVVIQPAPGVDGIGAVSYKVTNPSPGVWHYEYAIYNQNMDRGIQSFSVPIGSGVTLSNVGFHMPPQQPAWAADGTAGDAGFSNSPWTPSQSAGAITWASETMAQNQNANAIRWGSLYNFRFDSNRPPQNVDATVGFLKTGSPVVVQVQGPAPVVPNVVTVSGRVTNQGGTGIRGVYVYMVDAGNVRRQAMTNAFGYYSFDNVAGGQTYTFSVSSKLYTFNPTTVPINDNVSNLDFTALP